MKPDRGSLTSAPVRLLAISMVLAGYSCTTIPKLPEGQATLQGVNIHSTSELMDLVNERHLVPTDVDISSFKIEKPIIWYYDLSAMLINRLLFREPHPGSENIGYLRMEDPMVFFPFSGDTVETDTFDTFFNVWQFPGEEGKHMNLMVRSFETFPGGIFLPYFVVFDTTGNIIARQEHVAPVDAGPANTEGVMVWLDDFILPETGTYTIMVFADNKNLGTNQSIVRLGNERLHVGDAFEREGWWVYPKRPGAISFLIDRMMEKDRINVSIGSGLGVWTNSRIGKYELILWLY